MPRVLLIEDETPLRRIITLNLVRHGYTVAEADSAASAEEELLAAQALDMPFDVILLDVNLPDQTGWEVLRHAALAGVRRPRVIVVSALRPPAARIEEFRPEGALVKPFPIDALLRLLERTLAQPASEESASSEVAGA